MRAIFVFAAVFFALCVCRADRPAIPQSIGDGHGKVSGTETLDLPLSSRTSRPKLPLEAALKIAKGHLQKGETNLA